MSTFSVLTVSRRTGWERTAAESLLRQTKRESRWFVISENPEINMRNGLPWPALKAPAPTRPSNLNVSLNAGLRRITSDYVIFYQDFIDLPADCFEKLVALATPDTFVTTCTINANGSKDARYLGLDCPRPCTPGEWEANVAIAPMAVIRELGGFDEEYDNGWAWDNVNLAERAAMLGCKFLLDETNNPRLLPHDKSTIERLNGDFHAQRMADIAAGRFPLELNYL